MLIFTKMECSCGLKPASLRSWLNICIQQSLCNCEHVPQTNLHNVVAITQWYLLNRVSYFNPAARGKWLRIEQTYRREHVGPRNYAETVYVQWEYDFSEQTSEKCVRLVQSDKYSRFKIQVYVAEQDILVPVQTTVLSEVPAAKAEWEWWNDKSSRLMKSTKGRPVFIWWERAVCTCVSVWVCVWVAGAKGKSQGSIVGVERV